MFRRRSLTFLASFGLFFQLLVMGFHIPPALVIAGLASAPVSYDTPFRTIVICTSNGLKTISLDGNNQPLEGNAPSLGGTNNCPICQSLSGTALLAQNPGFPPQAKIRAISGPLLADLQRNEVHPLISLPRAPPLG